MQGLEFDPERPRVFPSVSPRLLRRRDLWLLDRLVLHPQHTLG